MVNYRSIMKYSKEEKVDMLSVYFEVGKSATHAEQLYIDRFPQRNHPSRRTFDNIVKQFRQTGNLSRKKPIRNKTVTNEANEIAVLAAVTLNPSMSSREIERQSAINRTSILRILKRHKFHPYHLSRVQELTENDFHQRLEFCDWALSQTNNFFENVMFTDEATFTKDGSINSRNMHYWSVENPHWFRQIDHQHRWSVNVWIGILGNRIIGPHFIEGALTGAKYAHFLTEIL